MRPEYVHPRPLVSTNDLPRLIRKSELTDEYIYKYRKFVEKPISLNVLSDLDEVTHNWTASENTQGRRLVKFEISQTSPNHFSISFHKIAHSEYIHSLPIISCIYWEELNTHIVTSVDIVLLLEFLVQQSFTIEEKNRIRRNLQSLKTYTISRLNQKNRRFFQLLMRMEDPRPRNIEKDLKIFKWMDLIEALKKLLSKYTPFMDLSEQPQQPEMFQESSSPPQKNPEFLPFERRKDLKRKLSMPSSIRTARGYKKLYFSDSKPDAYDSSKPEISTPNSAETNSSPRSSSAHSTTPGTPVGHVPKNPHVKSDLASTSILEPDPDWLHSQVPSNHLPAVLPENHPHDTNTPNQHQYSAHLHYLNHPPWFPQNPPVLGQARAPAPAPYPAPGATTNSQPGYGRHSLERLSTFNQRHSFSMPDISTMRPVLQQKSSIKLPPITSLFSDPPHTSLQHQTPVYTTYTGYSLGVTGSRGDTGPVSQSYGAP